MSGARRIGVFGGTFDPIHLGHLAATEDAAYQLSLDRVLFVPNRQPPHKLGQQVSPVADRVAMVELAVADNDLFAVSLVEIERPGPSYTIDTLRDLKSELGPETELFFLVGRDALPDLHTWHQPHALLDEFHVVVMDRPLNVPIDWSRIERSFPGIRCKIQVVHVAQIDISGVDIRERVRSGRPIRYQVPAAVERYIYEHGLYRAPEPAPDQSSASRT